MKIYTKEDIPFYQSDGHLKFDNEDYYSVQRFKIEFKYNYLSEEFIDNPDKNRIESDKLSKIVNKNDIYKIKPEQNTDFESVNCYLLSDLEEFYEKFK